jgi:hypothetical protein
MPAYKTYITGLDDALKCFDRAPSNLLKVVKQALRDGGKQAAKEIRKAMPRRFKRLVSCKVVKGSVSGDYSALIGAFNKVKSGTSEPDDWFKAYWKNYGTLTHRDPSHKFDYPIKPDHWAAAKRRRNRVGQPHENFYDGAIGPAQDAFLRAFQDSVKRQEDKLKER